MLGFAFGTLRLHRVAAAIGPTNLPSLALIDKLGFQREGKIRDHVICDGHWRDSLLFSLLADDPAARLLMDTLVRPGEVGVSRTCALRSAGTT